jgi:hypothetical protein
MILMELYRSPARRGARKRVLLLEMTKSMDGQAYPHPIVAWAYRVAGVTGILIGGYWLAAWFAGWAQQHSAAGLITMKTNMALGQFLSGAALLLRRR